MERKITKIPKELLPKEEKKPLFRKRNINKMKKRKKLKPLFSKGIKKRKPRKIIKRGVF